MGILDFFGFRKQEAPRITTNSPIGTVYSQTTTSGFVNTFERNRLLSGQRKYLTFEQMALNSWVVATGVSLYTDMLKRSKWTFLPAEGDADGVFAELAQQMIIEDPHTSFRDIIDSVAMYRFNGYSVQNWYAMRRDDGVITCADIQNRPVESIEEIILSPSGMPEAFRQRTLRGEDVLIPAILTIYLAEKTISKRPEGGGFYRTLFPQWQILKRYQQLLGYGYETDLRGTPVGRFPYNDRRIQLKRDNPGITDEQLDARVEQEVKGLETFIRNKQKDPERGIVLESEVFTSGDDVKRPISTRKFDIGVIDHQTTSFADIETSIVRINREMATLMGIEQLLLGSTSTGSFALASDQSDSFSLKIGSALRQITEAFIDQLLMPLWFLNGYDMDMLPTVQTELPKSISPEVQAQILNTLNGLNLDEGDTAVDAIRASAALPPAPQSQAEQE